MNVANYGAKQEQELKEIKIRKTKDYINLWEGGFY